MLAKPALLAAIRTLGGWVGGVFSFLCTGLREVQQGAGIRVLSVLFWNGTPTFTDNKPHPHSGKKKQTKRIRYNK